MSKQAMANNRSFLLAKLVDFSRRLYPIDTPAYLDLERYFPEHKLLEDNWEVIRDEITHIIERAGPIPKIHEIDKNQNFISKNDGISWKVFVVKLYDFWHHSNAAKCPKTVALLKTMKHVKTVNFSILSPGKHIPAHQGPYRGILRYQLPLEVPQTGDCYIIVDGKAHYWTEGKSVLFDDTYFHEVHNNTQGRRIALLLDIKRNDFGQLLRFYDAIYYRLIQLSIILNRGMKKSKVDQY